MENSSWLGTEGHLLWREHPCRRKPANLRLDQFPNCPSHGRNEHCQTLAASQALLHRLRTPSQTRIIARTKRRAGQTEALHRRREPSRCMNEEEQHEWGDGWM